MADNPANIHAGIRSRLAGATVRLAAAGCAVAAAFAVAIGCAVPVPPSGGPADETPPSLTGSVPENGTVGFAGDRVRLEFDEYVDERSVSAALSVTPAQTRPPEIRYGGRHVELRFREPLRDSTTYIVALDTGFRDAHGVAVTSPVRIAFSTGDAIDSGRLAGRVLDARSGRPSTATDVFAYGLSGGDAPDSLNVEPDYRTQTDASGRFVFEYLAERPFLVVAVRDANRNRRLDPGESVGVPPAASLVADTTGAEPDRPWLLAARDTRPPELRRVAARSASRIELLFSEAVVPTDRGRDAAAWAVEDSSGARRLPARLVATDADDPQTVLLRTEALPAGPWTVRADSVVADSSGNVLGAIRAGFTATTAPDTVQARFLGFAGDTLDVGGAGVRTLAAWARATVRWSDPVDDASVRGIVAVSDTAGEPLTYDIERAFDGSVRVWPDPGAGTTRPFDVSVRPFPEQALDTTWTARFVPATADALGELAGVVESDEGPVVVELAPFLSPTEPVRTTRVDSDGRFLFGGLPGGRRYRMRVFVDRDHDGAWSPGSVLPFDPPEPLGWLDTVPAVRARWETALPDTLRIGEPAARVAPDVGADTQ